MKGAPGLMIAIGFGVVGAVVNWLYMANASEDFEVVEFVAIARDANIKAGDQFRPAEHFTKVGIPREHVQDENLELIAVKWEQRANATDRTAWRNLGPGELLLLQDLQVESTKSFGELIGANERFRTITIDSGTIVPERMNPGDRINFLFPTSGSASRPDSVGPFEILAIGDRTGRIERGMRSGRVGKITIRYKENNKEIAELMSKLGTGGSKGMQVEGLPSGD